MKTLLLLSLALLTTIATAQERVPNLGDKVCALWTSSIDGEKLDATRRETTAMMDWWSLGFLKGMAAQYTYSTKKPSPLLKLRGDEALEWMRAYCRINARESISDAAVALLLELQNRQ